VKDAEATKDKMRPMRAKRTSPSPRARIGAWFRRAVRVSTAASVLLVLFVLIMGRNVYANARAGALQFGEELSTLRDSRAAGDLRGDYYRLTLNGQPVFVSSGFSKHGAAFVLRQFELECKEHADGMSDQFTTLPQVLGEESPAPPGGLGGYGTVREERGDRGYVMCFAQGQKLSRMEEVARLKAAVTTGDLGRLGDVRYVYAHDAAGGNGSEVFAAWTTGEFNVTKMFPKAGDAPGQDVPDAPRPEGSRRIFSGSAEGAPYGIVVYQKEGGEHVDIVRDVDAGLARHGWRQTPFAPQIGQVAHAFERGNWDLVVSVTPEDKGKAGISYVYSQMMSSAVSRALP
jgi:hypothetical protein